MLETSSLLESEALELYESSNSLNAAGSGAGNVRGTTSAIRLDGALGRSCAEMEAAAHSAISARDTI